MKLDDDQSNLARTTPIAPSTIGPARRNTPMKRTNERPSTQDLTPAELSGTDKIKAELQSAIQPIFEKMADDEWADAASVVSSLIPRAIAHRSAQREDRIAANVRTIAGEVGQESLATFQGVNDGNSAMLTSLVDSLFNELCPV